MVVTVCWRVLRLLARRGLASDIDAVRDPLVLRRIEHLALPVLVGVLPLVSYKNAEFLHNEAPGMQIPEAIRERMRKAPGCRRSAGTSSPSRCSTV